MADSGNEHGFSNEQYERYKKDGYTDEEILQIWNDREAMIELYYKKPREEQREITSSTYLRSQKRLSKAVSDWFGK